MQALIPFPDLSPELVSFTVFGLELALRWYALAYIAGLLIGWRLVVAAVRRPALWPGKTAPMTPPQVEDLLFWVILGVVLGGRIGFVLFYQPAFYLANPELILQVWQGGMAFHGGFLGVVVAGLLFCRRHKIPVMQAADALALATPPGLLLGRIANFVNGELWGRATEVPWAVAFPDPRAQICPEAVLTPEGLCGRHPSQLYEAGLEGLVLGAILLVMAFRFGALKRPGVMTGTFLAGYGAARFIVEFFRQPDAQFVTDANPLGHALQVAGTGVTMGQFLSLPMVLGGLALIAYARRRAPHPA